MKDDNFTTLIHEGISTTQVPAWLSSFQIMYHQTNERRSLYEQLQFLCTLPNTLMGKSWNFSSSRKLIKGQLFIV